MADMSSWDRLAHWTSSTLENLVGTGQGTGTVLVLQRGERGLIGVTLITGRSPVNPEAVRLSIRGAVLPKLVCLWIVDGLKLTLIPT